MAVTFSVAELAAALRLGDSAEETAEVTRLLAYCVEAIAQHAPSASDTAMNESARRLAGYLFDMPEAARSDGYSNAMRNSGAARMLLPYRVHRLGLWPTPWKRPMRMGCPDASGPSNHRKDSSSWDAQRTRKVCPWGGHRFGSVGLKTGREPRAEGRTRRDA